MTLQELVEHVVQRSEYTVRNGHLWTEGDHQLLVEAFTALANFRNAAGVDRGRRPSRRALIAKRRRRGC